MIIMKKTLSVVVPVYNEEKVIRPFHVALMNHLKALDLVTSVIYVNDGSKDASQMILEELHQKDPRVSIIELSRNFGHQAALSAGLDIADSDFILMMDGDGQHPPSLIPEMVKLSGNEYDIVLTQRIQEKDLGFIKRWTSRMFYSFTNKFADTRILPGSSDFRLINRRVLDSLRSMKEYHRFLRGMVAWVGFKSVIIPFSPPPRIAGESKYSFRKMLRLASDAIFSFSLAPLYAAISIGLLFLLLAFLEAAYVLSFWLTGYTSTLAPGWSSLMFVLLIIGGVIMISLGVIGMYIGYIFQEVKGRPVYIVRSIKSKNKQSTLKP
jgi:dolichol-phosphate mannosyltransferase